MDKNDIRHWTLEIEKRKWKIENDIDVKNAGRLKLRKTEISNSQSKLLTELKIFNPDNYREPNQ